MEASWLSWAKRLQALASTGCHFGASDFDIERYEEVAEIANNMLAELTQQPIERIQGLNPDFGQSYATPMIDVRGAVFSGDQILLVREKSDGLWTLPGGYADVGLSAAENVVKEIQEEAGIVTTARHLYAVRHKAKHEYRPDIRDFYKMYFLCEQNDPNVQPFPGPETSDAVYFSFDDLPPLSTGRVVEKDLHLARDFRLDDRSVTTFD